MNAHRWIGLALIVIGSVFALGLAVGFFIGLRRELDGRRCRRGPGADLSRRRRDAAPARDDGRKNSTGIYDRPWRPL